MPNEPAESRMYPRPPGLRTSHQLDHDFCRGLILRSFGSSFHRYPVSSSPEEGSRDPVSSSVVYTGPSTPSLLRWDYYSEDCNPYVECENTENISDDPPGLEESESDSSDFDSDLVECEISSLNSSSPPSTPPRERNIQLVQLAPNAPARGRGRNGDQCRFQYVDRDALTEPGLSSPPLLTRQHNCLNFENI